MRKNNFICMRCGEYIGNINGLIECPFCYTPLIDLEEKEDKPNEEE